MDNYLKFDEEDKKELNETLLNICNYEEDPLYNKDLDIKCNLEIQRKDLGKEKTLKYKVNEETRQIKINIPKEIENGQSIVLIKEGEKENKRYGNLIVNIKII